MHLRMKVLKWLARSVFKVPVGERLPWFLVVVRFILMPIETIRAKAPLYDIYTGVYTIRGVRITEEVFDAWSSGGFPEGTVFRLVKRQNGVITVEEVRDAKDFALGIRANQFSREPFPAPDLPGLLPPPGGNGKRQDRD